MGLETALIEIPAVFPLTIMEVQADTLSEMIVASDPCSHTGEREQACSDCLHRGISRRELSHCGVKGSAPRGHLAMSGDIGSFNWQHS